MTAELNRRADKKGVKMCNRVVVEKRASFYYKPHQNVVKGKSAYEDMKEGIKLQPVISHWNTEVFQ